MHHSNSFSLFKKRSPGSNQDRSPVSAQEGISFVDGLNMKPFLISVGAFQIVSMWGIAPLWLSLFIAVILVLQVAFNISQKVSWFKTPTILLGLILFFLYYQLNFTVEMAGCFLWLALIFKVMELKNRRDVLIFVYTSLYLCAVSLLFSQSIFQVLLQLLLVLACLGVLLTMNGGSALALKSQWRSLASVLTLALPMVVVLFLFFPRLSPLWTIPIKAKQATTGMSDSMTPGDIAELANSDERAFRVTFSEAIPAQSSLYWRGVVMDQFDGRTWRRSKQSQRSVIRRRYDLGRVSETSEAHYDVLLEPHNQTWVYTLEGAQSLSSNLIQRDMGLYDLAVEAIQPVRYRMAIADEQLDPQDASLLAQIPTGALVEGAERQRSPSVLDIRVPERGNPQTKAYVAQLKQSSRSDVEVLIKLLNDFQRQPFYYTLKPPVYGDNFVDGFMFEERRGFCAHYSGSLAYMLRLAGIPARVIGGYQGGERINDGEYLLIRQYDAHAWVEVRLNGLGWVRVDPTAMVAPNRIEQNLAQALSEEGSFLEGNAAARFRHSIGVLSWLARKSDELNYQWQKLVVNYSSDEQFDLFEGIFGNFSWAKLASVLIMPFVLVSVLVGFRYWWRVDRRVQTPTQRRYLRWLTFLGVLGHQRAIGESPRKFSERLERDAAPWLSDKTKAMTQRLEQDDYQ